MIESQSGPTPYTTEKRGLLQWRIRSRSGSEVPYKVMYCTQAKAGSHLDPVALINCVRIISVDLGPFLTLPILSSYSQSYSQRIRWVIIIMIIIDGLRIQPEPERMIF